MRIFGFGKEKQIHLPLREREDLVTKSAESDKLEIRKKYVAA